MKRRKPQQDHTSDSPAPTAISMQVIGHIHSPYTERFGTPRQPGITQQVLEDRSLDASIELVNGHNFEQALAGLQGFERIWVLSWMHLNDGWKPTVIPPRGPKERQGVFATRSPHRPNPIALSCLKLTKIVGRTLHVNGIDLLDGTPILDIKPYVPYADAFEDVKAGWLDNLEQDEPDRDS